MDSENKIFIDPNIERKKDFVGSKMTYIDGVPLFSILEFNLFGTCNRRCSFCPISKPEFKKVAKGLPLEMFMKVVNDLTAINYDGSLTFSAFSEPFLHKQLLDMIRYAREKLPNCKVDMVSNGDLVTEKNLQEVFEAGLNSVNMSLYDGPEQFDHFKKLVANAGLEDKKIFLRRRFFQDGNYGLTVSSRGGEIDSNKFRSDQEESIVELPLKRVCYYPFYMILVDYTGDVQLCSHDWSKKLSFGNIGTDNILDIWKSPKLQGIRKSLSKANRNIFPCNKCDVHGDLIGKEHFDGWVEAQSK